MESNREKLNAIFTQLTEIAMHENNLDVVDEVFIAARTIVSALRRMDAEAAEEEARNRDSEPRFLNS